MASTEIVSGALWVLLGLGLSGCSRTTYTYNCVDGFASSASTDAEALAGCGTHGGSLSKTPIVSRSRSSFRSGSRGFRSTRSRSSTRRSRSRR